MHLVEHEWRNAGNFSLFKGYRNSVTAILVPMVDKKERDSVTGAARARKNRRLQAKRRSATAKGIVLIEGALLIHDGVGDFAILQWDEEAEDFLVTHRGRLDEVPPKD